MTAVRRVIRGLIACFLSVIINSCTSRAKENSGWDRSNQMQLKRDLIQLLKRHGITLKAPECSFVGNTRTGFCLSQGSADLVNQAIDRLKLTPAQLYQLDYWQQEGGCTTLETFKSSPAVQVYWINGRPPELVVNRTTNFDYLLLYYRSDNEQICLQVSYSYG